MVPCAPRLGVPAACAAEHIAVRDVSFVDDAVYPLMLNKALVQGYRSLDSHKYYDPERGLADSQLCDELKLPTAMMHLVRKMLLFAARLAWHVVPQHAAFFNQRTRFVDRTCAR